MSTLLSDKATNTFTRLELMTCAVQQIRAALRTAHATLATEESCSLRDMVTHSSARDTETRLSRLSRLPAMSSSPSPPKNENGSPAPKKASQDAKMERRYRQFGARFQDSFERSGCSVSTSKHSLEDLIGVLKRNAWSCKCSWQAKTGRGEKNKLRNRNSRMIRLNCS